MTVRHGREARLRMKDIGTVVPLFLKCRAIPIWIIMTEKPTRRTVVKGAAATGLAATGLGAFGSSASAQQDIRNLNVQISDGLVNISNINVLQNVDVSNVDITVIGGDVNVNVENIANNLDIDVEDVQVVNVEDALNNNVVQVAVGVLGGTGDLVAAGSDAANL